MCCAAQGGPSPRRRSGMQRLARGIVEPRLLRNGSGSSDYEIDGGGRAEHQRLAQWHPLSSTRSPSPTGAPTRDSAATCGLLQGIVAAASPWASYRVNPRTESVDDCTARVSHTRLGDRLEESKRPEPKSWTVLPHAKRGGGVRRFSAASRESVRPRSQGSGSHGPESMPAATPPFPRTRIKLFSISQPHLGQRRATTRSEAEVEKRELKSQAD